MARIWDGLVAGGYFCAALFNCCNQVRLRSDDFTLRLKKWLQLGYNKFTSLRRFLRKSLTSRDVPRMDSNHDRVIQSTCGEGATVLRRSGAQVNSV
jgi:hypothetical protein